MNTRVTSFESNRLSPNRQARSDRNRDSTSRFFSRPAFPVAWQCGANLNAFPPVREIQRDRMGMQHHRTLRGLPIKRIADDRATHCLAMQAYLMRAPGLRQSLYPRGSVRFFQKPKRRCRGLSSAVDIGPDSFPLQCNIGIYSSNTPIPRTKRESEIRFANTLPFEKSAPLSIPTSILREKNDAGRLSIQSMQRSRFISSQLNDFIGKRALPSRNPFHQTAARLVQRK